MLGQLPPGSQCSCLAAVALVKSQDAAHASQGLPSAAVRAVTAACLLAQVLQRGEDVCSISAEATQEAATEVRLAQLALAFSKLEVPVQPLADTPDVYVLGDLGPCQAGLEDCLASAYGILGLRCTCLGAPSSPGAVLLGSLAVAGGGTSERHVLSAWLQCTCRQRGPAQRLIGASWTSGMQAASWGKHSYVNKAYQTPHLSPCLPCHTGSRSVCVQRLRPRLPRSGELWPIWRPGSNARSCGCPWAACTLLRHVVASSLPPLMLRGICAVMQRRAWCLDLTLEGWHALISAAFPAHSHNLHRLWTYTQVYCSQPGCSRGRPICCT